MIIQVSNELFEGIKCGKLIAGELARFLVEKKGFTMENPAALRPLKELRFEGKSISKLVIDKWTGEIHINFE